VLGFIQRATPMGAMQCNKGVAGDLNCLSLCYLQHGKHVQLHPAFWRLQTRYKVCALTYLHSLLHHFGEELSPVCKIVCDSNGSIVLRMNANKRFPHS
jgi:hypothetical protein